jgi:serine/threonine-protein kinase
MNGEVKVGDFGIAGLLSTQPGSTLTAEHEVVGTSDYLAPEARRGARPDPRQDVFAVGAVLYEMISGVPPLGSFEPLSGPIDEVVRRALAPEPSGRYSSAAELGAALAGLVEQKSVGDLPPDERTWTYAVSLLMTIATAIVLWAILLSITPKVIDSAGVAPLIMLGVERLDDGRIVSRARFETGPTLLALAAIVLALAGYGLLRLHWRRSGLDRQRRRGAIAEGRWVLVVGTFALAAYGVRNWLEVSGYDSVARYIPVVGGLIEVAVVFLFWVAILETLRTGRALQRQLGTFAGVGLALVPPIVELGLYLSHWQP